MPIIVGDGSGDSKMQGDVKVYLLELLLPLEEMLVLALQLEL